MATDTRPTILTEAGELPKVYDPKAVEGPVYAWWEERGYFMPPPERPDEPEPFTIILPPPNITGSLHNGHAMYTVEDVLIRWKRMQGIPTLWLPGTDHASIAGNCPNAMFSALAPRTHIPPHHGETNARIVVHLPLIVPEKCGGIRVGFQQREWKVGELLIFDDSI